ncbi:hypothetical protein ABFV54_14785 [Pseudomonas syringae]|uniref:hypothetical protein n=1 Tax=Pseudomonas syringae TaxID=317 RepID=UPI0034D4607A
MSLIVLLLLPFIGSCLAAFLPHNARNAESFLAISEMKRRSPRAEQNVVDEEQQQRGVREAE